MWEFPQFISMTIGIGHLLIAPHGRTDTLKSNILHYDMRRSDRFRVKNIDEETQVLVSLRQLKSEPSFDACPVIHYTAYSFVLYHIGFQLSKIALQNGKYLMGWPAYI